MAELIMFSLRYCPSCKKALQLIDQVKADQPHLAAVSIRQIDERKEKKLADTYDYYYVPAFFLGRAKLSEGTVDYAAVKSILEQAYSTFSDS